MLWLMIASAVAGTPGYQACCQASSAGACPSELQVVGPGTAATGEGGAIRLSGLWRLNCDGQARFDGTATNVTATIAPDGAVLTPMTSVASACFDAACTLPAALCVGHDGERAQVGECATSQPAPETSWQTSSVDDSRAVVIAGRVLKARTGKPITPPPSTPPTMYAAHQPGVHLGAPPKPDVALKLDLALPPEPPADCRPNPALRDASSAQVDEGNEASMQGDFGTALNKYRAALSISPCNAFAWADLGEALLTVDEPARARTALAVATRLMPNHYRAWTNLGRAEEALGRKEAAIEAYTKALEARPGHPPADEGLQRSRSR